MKYSNLVLAGLFGLALQGTASAQIYETEDAQGVPDFSDMPTQGAEVVDLPQTNLMAPPEAGEAPSPPEPATPPAAAEPTPEVAGQEEGASGGVYDSGDEEDAPRVQRHIDRDRIDNALPGEGRPGVGSAGAGPVVEPHAGEAAGAAAGAHLEGGEVPHGAGGRR